MQETALDQIPSVTLSIYLGSISPFSLARPLLVTLAPPGSSKDTLRPYVSFHAALRSAHQSFLSRLDNQTRQMLKQHLEASTRWGQG